MGNFIPSMEELASHLSSLFGSLDSDLFCRVAKVAVFAIEQSAAR